MPALSRRSPLLLLVPTLAEVQVTDWTMALNITNLGDKKYFAPCRNFGDCFTDNPRTVTGTISYRF